MNPIMEKNMNPKFIRKINFFILITVISSCSYNSNDQDMKYSPCKNTDVEEEIYQKQASLDIKNQNITVDCIAAGEYHIVLNFAGKEISIF